MKLHKYLIAGFLVYAVIGTLTVIAQANPHTGHGGDQHPIVEIPMHIATPRIELNISRDTMSGFNLHIDFDRFELESPRDASDTPQRFLEGHAHLYINGKKVQRLYAADVHLPEKLLRPGFNQITVTLNAHDHSTWSRGGKRILATLFIQCDRENFVLHRFSTSPISLGASVKNQAPTLGATLANN
ncbi:hypothetical protein P3339_20015 [Microbulbifer sp. MLAF003]|uniref:hypothetical protein n=1 Tax=unclassified Microbulbifer TaxID=2619833 RepID=UPI0024AE4A4B|nr:hypothetical protein [Microbulbifer sp. MLAF003]WHI50692.1 hypothetical protein P3339_20015 [Microbulbifer sp. MLAF003]